jgi:glutamate carboxypeptidase
MTNPTDNQTIAKLREYLEQNLPQYLDLLQQMVGINSFTANAVGVNKLGDLTAAAFSGLGFTADQIQCRTPAYGRHLVLTKPGRSGLKIGLISHLDTVFPLDEELAHDFSWRIEGDRIYGPGTMDIKGGTVVIYMMMAAIKALLPALYDDITWVVLLNAAEETIAVDFTELSLEQLKGNTAACLVFETGHLDPQGGRVVAARKGMALYRITVEGRGAHAGSTHARGANAVLQLAQTIQQINELTDYDRDITFNVGTIAGGTVINRIPHFAVASGEMRAFTPDVYDEGLAQLLAIPARATVASPEDGYSCQVHINLLHQTSPWPRNPGTDDLLNVWQTTGRRLGLHIDAEERGGLSDGNGLWRHLPTIDGLGPAGRNAHCSEHSVDGSKEQEYTLASSFVPKTLLNILAVANLVEKTVMTVG